MKLFSFAVLACVILSITRAANIPKRPTISDKIQEVLEKNPRLELVGSWDGRFFYFLDTTARTNQYDARKFCEGNGMSLARFESQEVLTHIGLLLPQDYCWTDGHIPSGDYVWEDSVAIPSDLLLTDSGSVGLVVDVYVMSRLKAYPSVDPAHYPLCMMTS